MEGFGEEVRQQEEGGTLVESLGGRVSGLQCTKGPQMESHVAVMMDQRASSAGEVVLLDDGDLEACLCQSSRCCDSADASALE